MTRRGRGRLALWLVGAVIVVVAAALALPLLLARADALYADRGRLAKTVRDAGARGPLLLVGLIAAQVIVAPIPGQALNFVSGYLYGFWTGLVYAWLGILLGSTAAILLARAAGRPLLERLLPPPTLAHLDRLAGERGLLFFVAVFLLPLLPDDLACFAAGLTALPLPALLVVVALARIPSLLASVWIGANAEGLTWQVWATIIAVSLASLLLAWRYGDRLQEALLRSARPRSGEK